MVVLGPPAYPSEKARAISAGMPIKIVITEKGIKASSRAIRRLLRIQYSVPHKQQARGPQRDLLCDRLPSTVPPEVPRSPTGGTPSGGHSGNRASLGVNTALNWLPPASAISYSGPR